MTTSGLVENLDASHLSFTADSVTINFAGSRWFDPGDTATIALIFGTPTAVAAPAPLLLVGAGLVGAGAWRRR